MPEASPAAAEVIIEGRRNIELPVAPSGESDYGLDADGIDRLPAGSQTSMTDVLAQLPGVASDQNQQIHIRDTEGPQFQYQINGFLVPLDINTNPPFLSMLNPLFVERLDLRVGVLPARYGLATGGVVDVQTKGGCRAPGAEVSLYGGQRSTISPSVEYAGCADGLDTYLSARATWSNTAFSSATPGPTPLHDRGRELQALGAWSEEISAGTRIALLVAATRSDNELPDAPGLPISFSLAGATYAESSSDIDSRLAFVDGLAMASIKSTPCPGLDLQLGLAAHFISQRFTPDPVGELLYQGVASAAYHADRDTTLQGDIRYERGAHEIATGFYVGAYRVVNYDDSLVFPVDANGTASTDIPVRIQERSGATNVISSIYISDLWRLTDRLTADGGLRGDDLTGYTHARQLSPRINLSFQADTRTSIHAGFASFLQVPSLLGIAPSAQAAFAGTSASGLPGMPLPLAESDDAYDVGVALRAGPRWTLSLDNYYERTTHYLDTGQFGVVPIFAPFNYGRGHLWGSELAASYSDGPLTAYANATTGRNRQQGVITGQFNFPSDELAYIDSHPITLDHQPLVGVTAGFSYRIERYSVSASALFSSGFSTGFADSETLPHVIQLNAGVGRTLVVTGWPLVTLRLTALNLLDRVNEIRSAQGIGIFEAAYGPRRTLYGTVVLSM